MSNIQSQLNTARAELLPLLEKPLTKISDSDHEKIMELQTLIRNLNNQI